MVSPTWGQINGEAPYTFYEWPKGEQPDLHDGTLADWAGVFPVHIAVEVRDDVVTSMDGIYIVVDGNRSGGRYDAWPRDEVIAALGNIDDIDENLIQYARSILTMFPAQRYFVRPRDSNGLTLDHPEEPDFVRHPPWGDSDGFHTPSGWAAEFALTAWDEFNHEGPGLSNTSQMGPSTLIGFDLIVQDVDVEGEPPRLYSLVGKASNMVFTDSLATGFLIGNCSYRCHMDLCTGNARPCWETVVLNECWATVKIKMRDQNWR